MESERTRTKQSKDFTALIWGMSILACVLLVAFVVIGTGFFRIQEVRAAISQPIFTEAPAEAPTAAPTAEPEATPTAEPIPESTPLPTTEPGVTEDLPDLELNIQGQDEMQMFASIPDVVEAASASVVGIIQYQPNARTGRLEEYGSGSGFIVSENGYVLTNAHVVSGAAAVDVLFSDGEKKTALIVGADVTMDVAVLKVEGEGYPALPIGDSSALRVGEYVIAIGNPLSTYQLYGTVTFGVISGTAREINIDGFVNTYLQTDAAINFGNSGGPLINMAGQVVGMNAAKSITAGYDSNGNTVSAEGIGFALPINNVIEIANVILREGGMVRPGIGVTIRAVDEETAELNQLPAGCRIEDVTAGAPADQAGLKVGDIVTEVDGFVVLENDDMVEYVRSKAVGDVVEFTVYREGEYLTIPVAIGDMNKFGN
ncbi:MAG: trypsin-like peptidase domain-containing protein [Clostridia bacterium]|nr:trypsin-like peptidase domain-containing protein [Clostridia bacterium]